jgi:hypothetical protein
MTPREQEAIRNFSKEPWIGSNPTNYYADTIEQLETELEAKKEDKEEAADESDISEGSQDSDENFTCSEDSSEGEGSSHRPSSTRSSLERDTKQPKPPPSYKKEDERDKKFLEKPSYDIFQDDHGRAKKRLHDLSDPVGDLSVLLPPLVPNDISCLLIPISSSETYLGSLLEERRLLGSPLWMSSVTDRSVPSVTDGLQLSSRNTKRFSVLKNGSPARSGMQTGATKTQ